MEIFAMNKSQLKGRQTRFQNFIKEMDTTPTYAKQLLRIRKGLYTDTRKRVE